MKASPVDVVEALQQALLAEHAAVYGYGIAGARLRGTLRQSARTGWDLHRARRDDLAARLTAMGADPRAAAPAYKLPARITSARSAAKVAAALEDDAVTAYAGLAGSGDAALRTFAARAMQEAMERAVRWRAQAGPPAAAGPASAFPGLPDTALSPQPRPGE
ncbi:ferritin-like domain-containing protein [Actinomadura sp. 9N407]|uniref:ferritin-like domain-containing protein n=1 Tax=Actinomadura sp. 9N407 TaxID=3375154 RepID=UPI0037883F8F